MVKPSSIVWNYFKISIKDGKKMGKCVFCKVQYVGHATRMNKHLKVCKNCPDNIKKLLTGEKLLTNLEETGQDNIQECVASTSKETSKKRINNVMPHSIRTFLDHVDLKTQLKLEEYLARSFYSGTISFRFIENYHFRKFFKLIRPSFIPPSRKQLSSGLLDKEYKRIKEVVDNKILNASSITILSDGWTDINGIPLINIMLSVPEKIFFKSIDSKTNQHSAEYMFKIFDSVIQELGPIKVNAICTDNAPVMKGAWKLVTEKYSHIFTFGCSAHSFNLIAKDICKLEHTSKCLGYSKKIVQYFKNKHIPKQVLKKIQLEHANKEMALNIPVETRWSTVYECFQSLTKNKVYLQAAIFQKEIIKTVEPSIKSKILDENFWTQIKKYENILEPIARAIKTVEGDTLSNISLIIPTLLEVKEAITTQSLEFALKEKIEMKKILDNRETFFFHDLHILAYILNPKLRGEKLREAEKNSALEMLIKISEMLNINTEIVLEEYCSYLSKSDIWAQKLLWTAANNTSATNWWKAFCAEKKISQVAIRILEIPSSSASCERNWKDHALIKTKKRNKLTIDRTEKLVFVKGNLNLLSEELLKTDNNLNRNSESKRNIREDEDVINEESEDKNINEVIKDQSEEEHSYTDESEEEEEYNTSDLVEETDSEDDMEYSNEEFNKENDRNIENKAQNNITIEDAVVDEDLEENTIFVNGEKYIVTKILP